MHWAGMRTVSMCYKCTHLLPCLRIEGYCNKGTLSSQDSCTWVAVMLAAETNPPASNVGAKAQQHVAS